MITHRINTVTEKHEGLIFTSMATKHHVSQAKSMQNKFDESKEIEMVRVKICFNFKHRQIQHQLN